MIIGAGAGQTPIIDISKKHGFFTLVVSPFGPYPGIHMADKHIEEDIYNVEKLVKIGKEEKIDYVISDQSDYAVPIVSYLSEKLGLPGNSVKVAQTYTYKTNFREFCKEKNIPCPQSESVSGDEFDEALLGRLKFPVVVKPTDSQGSRGITKVDRPEALECAIRYARGYSKRKIALIEEYFQGTEIVCEGFVCNGVYQNVAFGDRRYFKLPGKFIPSQTIFPSCLDFQQKAAIIENERRIAELLRPSFGIVHSEYLINNAGNFIIIESALRGGGVYIASHLIPLSTGVDLTKALFYAMVGDVRSAKEALQKTEARYACYLCFYLREGVVTSIEGAREIVSIPGVRLAEIQNIQIGDAIPAFEHKGMRKGPIIISCSDIEEMRKTVERIKETLKIEVDGKYGIVWE